MKKTIPAILILALCLTLTLSRTWAWQVTKDEAANDFTFADMTGIIIEDFEPPDELAGEDPYIKEVSVQNTSDQRAFIRVLLLPVIVDANGTLLTDTDTIGLTLQPAYDPNGVWRDGEDSYYYYTKAVNPGEETGLLLEELVITSQAGPEYDDAKLDIHVVAELCAVTPSYTHHMVWWQGDRPTSEPLKTINQLLEAQA